MTQSLQCKQCHGPITANDTRCFYCGTPVNQENEAIDTISPPAAEPQAAPESAANEPVQETLPFAQAAEAQMTAVYNNANGAAQPQSDQALNQKDTEQQATVAVEAAMPPETPMEQATPPVMATPAPETSAPEQAPPVAVEAAMPPETPMEQATPPVMPMPAPETNAPEQAPPVAVEAAMPPETPTEQATPPVMATSAPEETQTAASPLPQSAFTASFASATEPEGSYTFVKDSSAFHSAVNTPAETPVVEEPLTMAEPVIPAPVKPAQPPNENVFKPDFEDIPDTYQDLLLDIENDIPDEYSRNFQAFYEETAVTPTPTQEKPPPEYAPMSYNSLLDDEPPQRVTETRQPDMPAASTAPLAATQGALPIDESASYKNEAPYKKDSRSASKNEKSKRGSRLKVERSKESDAESIAVAPAKQRDSVPYFIVLPILSTLFSVIMLLAVIICFYAFGSSIGLLLIFPAWPLGLTLFSLLIYFSPLRYISGKRSVAFIVTLNLAFNLIMCIFAAMIIFIDLPFDITIWTLSWIAVGFVLPLLAFILGRPPAIRNF